MTDRDIMQQALEALEWVNTSPWLEDCYHAFDKEVAALRERLAQPEQEPVAWVREHEFPLAPGDAFSWIETLLHKTPLYTTPPQRKPLTDEEIEEAFQQSSGVDEETHIRFARAIEAKLKEKNT